MKRFDIFLRCVNLFALVGYLMNAISLLSYAWWNNCAKVNGVFHLFCLMFLITLEIQEPTPNLEYVQFMAYPFGRGLFYIWISFSVLNDSVVSVIGTVFTSFVGVCYVLAATIQACRGCRGCDPKVVLGDGSPTSATYTVHLGAEEHHAESSAAPLLPGYTKTDPNRR